MIRIFPWYVLQAIHMTLGIYKKCLGLNVIFYSAILQLSSEKSRTQEKTPAIHALKKKNHFIKKTTSLEFRPTFWAISLTYGRISKLFLANRRWIVCDNF